jgi:hypothetical protein
MNIDWSKAPEGTTHANPSDPMGIWRKVTGPDEAYWWASKEWVLLFDGVYARYKGYYVPKPLVLQP